MSTKNRAKGKLRQAKGMAKETAGKVTGNRRLIAEGKAEQAAGKAQGILGRITRAVTRRAS